MAALVVALAVVQGQVVVAAMAQLAGVAVAGLVTLLAIQRIMGAMAGLTPPLIARTVPVAGAAALAPMVQQERGLLMVAPEPTMALVAAVPLAGTRPMEGQEERQAAA